MDGRPLGKRVANALAVSERIIDAAEALFDERGVAATSLAHIAAEAKVSTGTVFSYYPAKADIIRAILTRRPTKLPIKDISSTSASTPEDALAQLKAIIQRAVEGAGPEEGGAQDVEKAGNWHGGEWTAKGIFVLPQLFD